MSSKLWFYLLCCYQHHVIFAKIKLNTINAEFVRATPFRPEVINKVCLLKPESGPCRADISMHFFEPSSFNCSTFSWGGCQGNGNRFDSHSECISTCLSSPNHQRTKPNWCSLNFDYGFCFGALKRWYYDPIWKICKERIYSGCGGNKNNFYNREQCDAICRFGSGPLSNVVKNNNGVKKILIINPWNATPKKGRNQTLPLSTPEIKNTI